MFFFFAFGIIGQWTDKIPDPRRGPRSGQTDLSVGCQNPQAIAHRGFVVVIDLGFWSACELRQHLSEGTRPHAIVGIGISVAAAVDFGIAALDTHVVPGIGDQCPGVFPERDYVRVELRCGIGSYNSSHRSKYCDPSCKNFKSHHIIPRPP